MTITSTVEIGSNYRVDDDDVASIVLPGHICLSIRHNPHRSTGETLDAWIRREMDDGQAGGWHPDELILPEDLEAIYASGEVWVISWCPHTTVGAREVIAASLARALELANR